MASSKKKIIEELTKIAELKFVVFCFIPKKKGFKIKKYSPGIAQKIIKNVIEMYLFKINFI